MEKMIEISEADLAGLLVFGIVYVMQAEGIRLITTEQMDVLGGVAVGWDEDKYALGAMQRMVKMIGVDK